MRRRENREERAAGRGFGKGCKLNNPFRSLACFLLLLVALVLPLSSAPSKGAALNDEGGSSRGSGAPLLEAGGVSKLEAAKADETAELRIVSYNIRWCGGEDLRELIRLLREDAEIGRATIIGLQEVDRNRKRTGHVNTARLLAEELGMHYVWAAPPTPDEKKKKREEPEEETGVAILSPFPLTEVERIVLPHEGPGRRRRAAVGATLLVGGRRVRVYSLHAETRIGSEKKLEQFRAVLDALERHTKIDAAVVLGDFNTWRGGEADDTDEMFRQAGFQTPIPKSKATFKDYWVVKLKLDWIWLRGLESTTGGIDRDIKLSDHWPLWLTAGFEKKVPPAAATALPTSPAVVR
jgi:endonuclease/exonuclease/phosphatase family metal-dependent hydrolase